MKINWDVIIRIVIPFSTLLLGKYLDRWFSKKPKLISYLGHTSAFNINSEKPMTIHTHSIVVRNAGRATAKQVRIGHYFLPKNIQIFPNIAHTIEDINGGGTEIVIPKLVPEEQITISYLYFPPLIWSQINSYTKSDEGFAKILKVLPTPQLPRWLNSTLWVLIFMGVVSLIYIFIEVIKFLINIV